MIRTLFKVIMFFIFLWWFLFSHVSIQTDKYRLYSLYDENYIADWYKPNNTNLIGLYLNLHYYTDDAQYVVLRHKNGKYIGQSSPFRMNPYWGEKYGIFPNEKSRKFFSLYEMNDEDLYTISLDERKWWDYFLKYFY